MIGHPTELEARWLMSQGISDTALLQPTCIRAANVNFLDGHTFEFDRSGVRALLCIVDDCGYQIDWVAWQPKHGQLATWRGVAFALGQEAITIPATYFAGGKLRVHRSPLEWLKAERDGIVILRPVYAHAYLRDRNMSCADRALARQLTQWIQPPRPRAEIFIEERVAA